MNKTKKVILVAYLIVIMSTILLFVPHKINYTTLSEQRVPHSVTLRCEHHPIWFSYEESEKEKNDNRLLLSSIDYARLFVQLIIVTIFFSIIYLIFNKQGVDKVG